jgi:hypothetical protein
MKPLGDLYQTIEVELQEKYKNNPAVLEDMRILTGLLASWYISVFMGLLKTIHTCPECSKLAAVIEKLERNE